MEEHQADFIRKPSASQNRRLTGPDNYEDERMRSTVRNTLRTFISGHSPWGEILVRQIHAYFSTVLTLSGHGNEEFPASPEQKGRFGTGVESGNVRSGCSDRDLSAERLRGIPCL